MLDQFRKMNPSDLFKNIDVVRLEIFKIFNKSENDVNEDVKIIKKWLGTQPHLPETMPDTYIMKFLFLNKVLIEKTKRKIDMYYTIRSLIPDFYNYANPKLPKMKKCLENYNVCLHPKLFQGVNRVTFYKQLHPNIFGHFIPEIITMVFNVSEIRLLEDYAYKDIHIFDLKNITISDVAAFTPTICKKSLTIYEKVFSTPLKAAYLINAPPFVSTILTVLKALIKPKIFERIHVCENSEILKNIFTVDDLPKDYGGGGPSLQELTDILKFKFEEHGERFDQLDELRVKESLRPEPLVDNEMLGVYGNFKKLSVD